MIEGKINWTGSETVSKAIVTEDKKILDVKDRLELIDALIIDNKNLLDKHIMSYALYSDTDLGSTITRLEQNIVQLRKIKYSLIEE
jgi:hypothetical protein